jgi:hypothetical protein
MHNRFFLWLYSYANPVQLDLVNLPPDLPATDLRYFVRILQHLDGLFPGAGMTFALTWHLDAYHEVMKNAVVLLVGDERYQTPSYQRRVRAIFKTGGVRPNPVGDTLRVRWPVAWRGVPCSATPATAQPESSGGGGMAHRGKGRPSWANYRSAPFNCAMWNRRRSSSGPWTYFSPEFRLFPDGPCAPRWPHENR